MTRGEIIILSNCNFKCPYCRGLRGDCAGTMSLAKVKEVLSLWAKDGLRNVRFSGGEPTLHPNIKEIIAFSRSLGVKRIAISTNGSAPLSLYQELISLGVNDLSVSLDACCSSVGKRMCGGVEGAWEKVVSNIRELAKLTYVTVGMVLTADNADIVRESVLFAHSLGVADIRVIPSAQGGKALGGLGDLPKEVLDAHPILAYRVRNMLEGVSVRGLGEGDWNRCPLVMDDSAVSGNWHFPCIIYLREKGNPIGRIGPTMREERVKWAREHDCLADPICRGNCLDACIAYNAKFAELQMEFDLPEMDATQFDWLSWRGGGFSEWENIVSDEGKAKIRKYAIGWCRGESLTCRPKPDEFAVMFLKGEEQRWFHMRKREFYEVFGRIRGTNGSGRQ